MTDVHSKAVRSYNMRRIKGKNTKPEMLVRKFLFSKGFRYRLHDSKLPGKPDIVLPKYKTAIFIHGCFWHGHEGCRFFVVPQTRTDWWLNKINGNIINDARCHESLTIKGWRTLVIWECELKPIFRESTLNKLIENLNSLLVSF
jgi:DNA mismatch endonuclease (patch repair protein)